MSSVGVVYMGRERVDRTQYDTIMDWLKAISGCTAKRM